MRIEDYPEEITSEVYEEEGYGYDPYGDWEDADVSVKDFI